MFDELLAAMVSARTPSERVAAGARLENAACAARLASMADMLELAHAADGSSDRDQWRLDNWSAVCAHIGAVQNLTSGMASGLLMDAITLRERLPKVAEAFAAGLLSLRLVHAICARTMLVQDPVALRAIDAELAEQLRAWGIKSVNQTDKDIDALVLKYDRYAVRRTETAVRGTHVDVRFEDATGVGYLDAKLTVTDAQAVDTRADALAHTVCDRDPRTLDQRRAAALGAMGLGWDRLPCMCEQPDCVAATKPSVGGVVVHVIARADTIEADTTGPIAPEPEPESDRETEPAAGDTEPDPARDTEPITDRETAPQAEAEPDSEPHLEPHSEPRGAPQSQRDHAADARGADTAPVADTSPVADRAITQRRSLVGAPPPLLPKPWFSYTWSGLTEALNADAGECPAAPPAVILGGPVLPSSVAALAAMHAKITPLVHPGPAPPESRYRPSKALAEFVRCRDLTCRFPGCTKPATVADLDHTIPWPYGPTCGSNLACLCREHHLLKTFWPGWHNEQSPDGTIVWTDPDGNTHTTYPGSKLLFPELCAPTAKVVVTGTPPAKHTAGLTMPKRETTRAAARHQRIEYERRLNESAPHVEDDSTQ